MTTGTFKFRQELCQPPSRLFFYPTMPSSLFSNLLVSSLLIVGVHTTPLPSPRAGRVIPISRSFHHKPAINSSSFPVFDRKPIERELKGLWPKFCHARQFFDGIGLQPGLNLDDIMSATSTEAESEEPFISPDIINTGVLQLKDCMAGNLDMMYYGPVDFGTPSQKLTVDIDTGSADLWIPVNCSECANNQFKDVRSSTCTNSDVKFSVSYGSGEVSGTLMQDAVSVAGLNVQDQYFGAVSQVSDEFNDLPNDGLFGMAFGTIAQSGKPTFFETLIKRNMLPAPMFSVHLARNQVKGSEVCFGCFDELKAIGPIEWVPVVSKTYWSVSMDAVAINTTDFVPTEIIAIIDTGTTLIYLPSNVASEFYAMIPGSKPAPQFGPEFYTYPCSSKLDVALSFDGRLFSISTSDFNLGMTWSNSPDCVGGILSLDQSAGFPQNLAIIGDEFLKSWYTTYDYSEGTRVGFAPSINNQ
ncbi:aspartic peptidase domain-containing protein [Mycena sp. CBHHK59/15]|nr:aspartic peptidase domain-containing protein [Mycena sp. CBHHK59/15]